MLPVPAAEPVAWECWADAKAGVGETPIWDPESGALFWIDIFGPTLSRCGEPGGEVCTWTFPEMVGSYALAPADQGCAVVALAGGVYLFDLASGELSPRYPAPYDPALFHFSDGRCDPAGRFWVGTNRQPGSGQPRGSAAVYRIDERGISRQIEGVTISNGLAFSPDGSLLYLADHTQRVIWSFDYELATGTPENRRPFAHLPAEWIPDGAAVDAGGGYWSAMYGSGVIVRFDRSGRVDRVLRAPVTHPTMVCFGGEGGRTLFVTSARRFADPSTLRDEPLAGAVFCAEVGACGVPEPRFAFADRSSYELKKGA